MTGILWRCLAGFLALIVFAWFVLLRPVAQPATHDPLQVFDHGSIGNETQQGIPYWIWRVLPTLFPEYLPGNQDGYGSIGVYWVAGEELPVGFSRKTLGVIPRSRRTARSVIRAAIACMPMIPQPLSRPAPARGSISRASYASCPRLAATRIASPPTGSWLRSRPSTTCRSTSA